MTTERIDHVAEAREWLVASERPTTTPEMTNVGTGIAQVHATLAHVEQQRFANLIAVGAAGMNGSKRSEVWEGLGLS